LVVLASVVSLAPLAVADEYRPSDPIFRPALGWVCYVRHTVGDLDGDGQPDRVVVFDRSGPHQVCDEMNPAARWHVDVVLGRGGRLRRPLPCDKGPVFCRPVTGDLEGDGRDEVAVETCCGAIVSERQVYRLSGHRLVSLRFVGPGVGRLRAGSLVLTIVSDSGTHDGFGCRAHPDGATTLIAWTGELVRPGLWRLERARLRGSDGVFWAIGVRRFRMEPRGLQPRGPRADACFRTP
jgi:hypothetical protein